MSTDNNFFLQLMASHPFIQECAKFDEDTYEYIKSSHPAVAQILKASKAIVDAADVGYGVPEPDGWPWNLVKAVEVGRYE